MKTAAALKGERMEFGEVAARRRSVRRFKPDPVDRETVIKLLECATSAPSAGNAQPWRFLVIGDGAMRQQLARAAFNQNWMAQAPLIIVVLADLDRAASSYGRRGMELYALQDTAAATQNLLLAAADAGLGACWVGAFSEADVSKLLGLPERFRPVAMVPLGMPAGNPAAKPRRLPLDEVVFFTD